MRIRLEEFPERVSKMHRTMTRRLALGIWSRLIFLTPVDTGWARFHWILTWERRDSRRPGQPPEDAQPESYAPPRPNTDIPPLFPRAYIQNRVPYIERLNDGWSRQRPANFVENAVEAEFAVLRRSNRRGPYE